MKILFLTENFPPENNAAASRVFERAVYWVGWGHEVTVITCAPNFPNGRLLDGYSNRWYQTEEISGIKVVRVKTFIAANQGVIRRSFDFLSFLFSSFAAGIFQKQPDIIVATSPQFFAAVSGYFLGLVRRRPFVFELGDLWPSSISAVGVMKRGVLFSLMEKAELYLYRRSTRVAALTLAFKDNLVSRKIPPDKIEVVRNGVDLRIYQPKKRDTSLANSWGIREEFVIGYIGTHGMAHGLINVLEAAEELKNQADILFLFVGEGAEREMLIDEANKKNLTNVRLVPGQPKEKTPDIWSICDIALVHLKDSPVFSDVLPSKIFEAMAMGLPVMLVSPKGEASSLVEEYGIGSWITSGYPDKLAKSLISLKEDKVRLERYAKASLNAAPNFSRENQSREMLIVFEKAIQSK